MVPMQEGLPGCRPNWVKVRQCKGAENGWWRGCDIAREGARSKGSEGGSRISGWGSGRGSDFGDFGVAFITSVTGLDTRQGGPLGGLSVQGWTRLVPTRGPLYLLCKTAPQ